MGSLIPQATNRLFESAKSASKLIARGKALFVVIGKYEYSEIGKQRYLKNGNKYAVKTATTMQ